MSLIHEIDYGTPASKSENFMHWNYFKNQMTFQILMIKS